MTPLATPRVIVDATVEPLLFTDIVAQGRRPANREQALAAGYIKAARQSCEDYLNSTISPKTLEIALPSFVTSEGFIELPLGPVRSIVSVTYTDADGAAQTFSGASYALDQYRQTAALRLAYNVSWPSTRAQFDAVKVRYVAGYGLDNSPPAPAVPQTILQAMLLTVDHFMEHRTAVDGNTLAELPLGVKHLLDPYRRQMGV